MYSYDQIFRNERDLKFVKLLLDMAKEKGLENEMTQILFEGQGNSFSFDTHMSNKNNPPQEQQRRISLAYLLLNNPETYKELAKDGSFVFHGTNINALPGILKYGLNSFKKSTDLGINVNTGEEVTRRHNTRDFVSFADIFDIASEYSQYGTVNKTKISFPIIICTSKDRIAKYRRDRVHSDVPEIGVNEGFKLDDITAVLVPSDKVKYVKKLVKDKNIKVLGMDGQDKKFFWYDDMSGLNVVDSRLEEFKKNSARSSSKFNKAEIKKLAGSRLLSGIKNQFQKLTNLLKGEEKEYAGKCR